MQRFDLYKIYEADRFDPNLDIAIGQDLDLLFGRNVTWNTPLIVYFCLRSYDHEIDYYWLNRLMIVHNISPFQLFVEIDNCSISLIYEYEEICSFLFSKPNFDRTMFWENVVTKCKISWLKIAKKSNYVLDVPEERILSVSQGFNSLKNIEFKIKFFKYVIRVHLDLLNENFIEKISDLFICKLFIPNSKEEITKIVLKMLSILFKLNRNSVKNALNNNSKKISQNIFKKFKWIKILKRCLGYGLDPNRLNINGFHKSERFRKLFPLFVRFGLKIREYSFPRAESTIFNDYGRDHFENYMFFKRFRKNLYNCVTRWRKFINRKRFDRVIEQIRFFPGLGIEYQNSKSHYENLL